MKKNIWQQLAKKKTFFVLAPMAGVTDSPFRQIISEIGSPDLMFTEFVSTEHVVRHLSKTPLILKYSKKERPLIAQFFGCKPEQFRVCAELAVKLGFDGIDLNMGCPDRKVQKQGAGSELIKNPELALEIIRAVKGVVKNKIPVSVKTRLGYDNKNIEYLILNIAREGVDAVTIHGRTVKQGYSGAADWEAIGKITKKIKKINPNIVVIGNGDVKNLEQGKMLAEKYGVDGVMIGREILKNPWVFNKSKSESPRISIRINPNIKERAKIALKHTKLFEKFYNKVHSGSTQEHGANIGAMKKYYKAYFAGVHGGEFPKKELMEAKSIGEAERLLQKI